MSVFTNHLKEEHQIILRALDLLELYREKIVKGYSIEKAEATPLIFLLRKLIEDVHHKKEEELLFPALQACGRIEGGPRCTFFMGSRMQHNPAERLLLLARQEASADRVCSSNEKRCSNALDIPLEEHEAGHYALMRIALEIDLKEKERGRETIIADKISDYLQLMRLHIDKEDTCLFEMANSMLSHETQSDLLTKAYEIDRFCGFVSFQKIDPLLVSIESSLTQAPRKSRRASYG